MSLPRRRHVARTTTVLATMVLAGAVAITGAMSASSSPPTRPGNAFGSIQESVPPAGFDAPSNEALSRSGSSDRALGRLATIGGVDFYRWTRNDGNTCFAISSVRGERNQLGDVACLDGATANVPLLDMSGFTVIFASDGTETVRLSSVQGFAADDVKSVGVVTSTGAILKTPVVNGAYRLSDGRLPTEPVTEIIALDGAGQTIYSKNTE